jgi:ACDE family multidrug resistance protein
MIGGSPGGAGRLAPQPATVAGTAALASPLVGRVIDRRGVPMPLTVGLVLYGVAGGAGLVLTSYPALLLGRLLFGVGAAVVFTGTTVALLDHPGTARDQVMGWRSSARDLA